MSPSPKPHRPVLRDPGVLEALGQGSDPIAELAAAHESAAVLLHAGRAADDPAVTARLISIVDAIGLSTVADLWAASAPHTLPGALWRLYSLREWMITDPQAAAREYAVGIGFAEPDHAIAAVEPPTPDEVRRVADEILRGVFTGDFAVALERAAAFCHVVASGRAHLASGTRTDDRAEHLHQAARDLTACAERWRTGSLQ